MPPSWLPLLIALIGLGAMVTRSPRMRWNGVNPWVLSVDDTAVGFLGRCFFALVALYLATLITWAASPDWVRQSLGTIPSLDHPSVAWTGILLALLGIVLILLAQRQMGLAWRVGIPDDEQPRLVTDGVFSRSRNPVFFGMLCVGLGVALVIPNSVTWAVLAATYVALSVQVRLEESFLTGALGDGYEHYKAQVSRWFGMSKQPAGAA